MQCNTAPALATPSKARGHIAFIDAETKKAKAEKGSRLTRQEATTARQRAMADYRALREEEKNKWTELARTRASTTVVGDVDSGISAADAYVARGPLWGASSLSSHVSEEVVGGFIRDHCGSEQVAR